MATCPTPSKVGFYPFAERGYRPASPIPHQVASTPRTHTSVGSASVSTPGPCSKPSALRPSAIGLKIRNTNVSSDVFFPQQQQQRKKIAARSSNSSNSSVKTQPKVNGLKGTKRKSMKHLFEVYADEHDRPEINAATVRIKQMLSIAGAPPSPAQQTTRKGATGRTNRRGSRNVRAQRSVR